MVILTRASSDDEVVNEHPNGGFPTPLLKSLPCFILVIHASCGSLCGGRNLGEETAVGPI